MGRALLAHHYAHGVSLKVHGQYLYDPHRILGTHGKSVVQVQSTCLLTSVWFERLERREKDRQLDAVTVSCKESCEGSIGNWPESAHAPGAPVISSAVVRDDARRRGGEAIVASLLSLLEGCSCNGHAGVGLICHIFFDPAQPAARSSLSTV